jgi:hypothetical protein
MLNISGFARLTNDGIQSVRVPDVLDGLSVLKTTYENIGIDNAYGTSIFMNVNAGKLSLNGGTDIYYAFIDNNNPVDSLRSSNEGMVAYSEVMTSARDGVRSFSVFIGDVRCSYREHKAVSICIVLVSGKSSMKNVAASALLQRISSSPQ